MEVPGWWMAVLALGGILATLVWLEHRQDLKPSHGGSLLGVGSLFVLVALVLGGCLRRTKSQAREMESWPTAPGTILESNAVRGFETRGPADRPRSRSVRGLEVERAHTVDARIRYRYVVDGVTYTNDQVTPGQIRANDDTAQWLRRYPTGAAVPVRYHPQEPARAVLESGAAAVKTGLGMALTAGAIGLVLGGYGIRLLGSGGAEGAASGDDGA